MQTGISGLVIPKDWTFDQTLQTVEADGYSAFEPALRDGGYLSLTSTEDEIKAVRDRAGEAGVALVSACPGGIGRPRNLLTNDEQTRRDSIATFRECIRVTRAAQIDTLLLVLGQLTPDVFYDEAWRNALASMRELAPIAEDQGVKLAIEYVWNKFLLSPIEFARFLDEVDSPSVGFYFDPGNMTIFGYAEHWVRICGRHIMAVHMKDFRRAGSVWTPLLEGDVDFNAVMRELKAVGFDGALVSEVDAGIAPFRQTAGTIEKIKAMG